MTAFTPMSESEYRRITRLPDMLDRARRRVAQLECDARHYGMNDLLDPARQA